MNLIELLCSQVFMFPVIEDRYVCTWSVWSEDSQARQKKPINVLINISSYSFHVNESLNVLKSIHF